MPVLPTHALAVTPHCPGSSGAWGGTGVSREQSTARAAPALLPAGSRPGVCFVAWGWTGTALPSPPVPIRLPLSSAWLGAAGRAGQRVSPRDGAGRGCERDVGLCGEGGDERRWGGERLGAGWGGGGSWVWGERAGGGWAGTRCEDFFLKRLIFNVARPAAAPRPGTTAAAGHRRHRVPPAGCQAAGPRCPRCPLGPRSTAGGSALSPGEPRARSALPVLRRGDTPGRRDTTRCQTTRCRGGRRVGIPPGRGLRGATIHCRGPVPAVPHRDPSELL